MRRFSSEGSLLGLDVSGGKNSFPSGSFENSDIFYSSSYGGNREDSIPEVMISSIQESRPSQRKLRREQSVSVDTMNEVGKRSMEHLNDGSMSEGSRAYSDGQIAADPQEGCCAVETDGQPSAPLAGASDSLGQSEQRHHHRAKLSAAKLHLKSLFGQVPHHGGQNFHSSNPDLSHEEDKDSARQRRSRLDFMRQWNQGVLAKRRRINRDELESWANSLDKLLASQTGVSVFGAFLRSEYCEENLQFYLACEQFKHSSTNFSLQRRAKEIRAMYIQNEAPREVNLDSKTRELTLQLLQAPSHTSLQEAQKRIYYLLDTDCYPRFLQSNIYQSLLQEAE